MMVLFETTRWFYCSLQHVEQGWVEERCHQGLRLYTTAQRALALTGVHERFVVRDISVRDGSLENSEPREAVDDEARGQSARRCAVVGVPRGGNPLPPSPLMASTADLSHTF